MMAAPLEELIAVFRAMTESDNTEPEVSGRDEGAASSRESVAVVDHDANGWHLDVSIPLDRLVEAAGVLDREEFAFDTITGVDWIAAGDMEVVYDFFHPGRFLRVVLRVRVRREQPEVPTILHVFPGAGWHERETHDFFGIRFSGHPDLSPLLLPEDADYHPLRKDFTGVA